MQNLMVTGGAGFIGSNFVRYMLQEHQVHIVVYDKLTYAGNMDNLKDVAEQFADRYAFEKGDIADAAQVDQVIQQYQVDTIVNFAAETHVDRSLMEAGGFITTDVFGTYVLLEAAKKHGVERYHQVSTDEVYGQVLTGSSVETDPLHTRNLQCDACTRRSRCQVTRLGRLRVLKFLPHRPAHTVELGVNDANGAGSGYGAGGCVDQAKRLCDSGVQVGCGEGGEARPIGQRRACHNKPRCLVRHRRVA